MATFPPFKSERRDVVLKIKTDMNFSHLQCSCDIAPMEDGNIVFAKYFLGNSLIILIRLNFLAINGDLHSFRSLNYRSHGTMK